MKRAQGDGFFTFLPPPRLSSKIHSSQSGDKEGAANVFKHADSPWVSEDAPHLSLISYA